MVQFAALVPIGANSNYGGVGVPAQMADLLENVAGSFADGVSGLLHLRPGDTGSATIELQSCG
jgi:hypothetical protein